MPINDKRFYPLYATCMELDIPICITTGVARSPGADALPERPSCIDEVCWFFPELTFVIRTAASRGTTSP